MIIGTVTGSWGDVLLHLGPDGLGWGLPWGPIMGLLIGMVVRRVVRLDPRARDGHVQGRPDRVGRRDQPRGVGPRAVPVLRSSSGRPRSRTPGQPHLNPSTSRCSRACRWGLGRAFHGLVADGDRRVPAGVPGDVLALQDAVGPAAAVMRREPRGRAVPRRARGAAALPGRAALRRARRVRGRVPGGRGRPQLERGPDAGPRVHRSGRVDPVELEPEAPDGGRRSSSASHRRSRSGSPTRPIIRLIPPEFIRMTPYVVTIVVLAGFVGKVRPPAAAGRAYEGGSGL